MQYVTELRIARKFGGRSDAEELGLPVSETGSILPCGGSVRHVF